MKVSIKHPSEFLPAMVTDQIRSEAAMAEQEKKFNDYTARCNSQAKMAKYVCAKSLWWFGPLAP